jgi:hypothetical protein
MRIEKIVQRICEPGRGKIHMARLGLVAAVVVGILRVGRLSVSAVGRGLEGGARPKHAIKRVDRALSNAWIHVHRDQLFRLLARHLIGAGSRPLILVDWTKVGVRKHALVAAVPIGGRALTLYAEVHPETRLGRADVQRRFLRRLAGVLPPDCRPIIVADAGFHGAFFNAVARLGWDFVGRLRGLVTVDPVAGGTATTNIALQSAATLVAHDAGTFFVAKSRDRYVARIVTQRHASTNRKWRHLPKRGNTANAVRGAHEPWILVTSLPDDSAARIANIYATRMQIEETFRDTKNPRFGWALRHVRCRSVERLANLLLFAAFAMFAASVVGWHAEQAGLHRAYQANTLQRRVLSIFVLGCAVIARNDEPDTPSGFALALAYFRRHAIS